MQKYQQAADRQTRTNSVIAITCLFITLAAISYATGQQERAKMDTYAITHNCQWEATGTLYGDDRDYTCN